MEKSQSSEAVAVALEKALHILDVKRELLDIVETLPNPALTPQVVTLIRSVCVVIDELAAHALWVNGRSN